MFTVFENSAKILSVIHTFIQDQKLNI